MRIAELVNDYGKDYGLDKRTIDYYSAQGLIPFSREEGNGKYRDYGPEAIVAVKKIIILRDAGLSEIKIKEALRDPSYFTTARWNDHIEGLRKKIESINKMISYAEELRDTCSYSLRFANELDNARESKIVTRLLSIIRHKLEPVLFSKDEVVDLADKLPEDIGDVFATYNLFIDNIFKKFEQQIRPESDDVQLAYSKLYNKLRNNFGTIVYYLFDLVRDVTSNDLELNEEEGEIYSALITMFGICADWFRTAKSIEASSDTDRFYALYQEQIHEFDKLVEDSTADTFIEIISGICHSMSHISVEALDHFTAATEVGFEVGAEVVQSANNVVLTDEGEEYLSGIKAYVISGLRVFLQQFVSDQSTN